MDEINLTDLVQEEVDHDPKILASWWEAQDLRLQKKIKETQNNKSEKKKSLCDLFRSQKDRSFEINETLFELREERYKLAMNVLGRLCVLTAPRNLALDISLEIKTRQRINQKLNELETEALSVLSTELTLPVVWSLKLTKQEKYRAALQRADNDVVARALGLSVSLEASEPELSSNMKHILSIVARSTEAQTQHPENNLG